MSTPHDFITKFCRFYYNNGRTISTDPTLKLWQADIVPYRVVFVHVAT